MVCPYPPGIPLLLPGEVVTEGGDRLSKTNPNSRWNHQWMCRSSTGNAASG
ncbi:hypothetical protein [Leptothermofonsia sp. ETS-13]|uniref:Orn/Lys/Arg family decarboxylase n=1 Tax=Leptothermofonsia sp. ETS-13 TaxID=3035696 RepID=UPI003BA29B6A